MRRAQNISSRSSWGVACLIAVVGDVRELVALPQVAGPVREFVASGQGWGFTGWTCHGRRLREAGRCGVGPAVVLGELLTGAAWAIRNGAGADLTGRDRETGNGHRVAVGTWAAHRLHGATVPEWRWAVPRALLAGCKAARADHGLRLVRSG